MCGLNQSPHQLMFNLYNIIALTGETAADQFTDDQDDFVIIAILFFVCNPTAEI